MTTDRHLIVDMTDRHIAEPISHHNRELMTKGINLLMLHQFTGMMT